MKNFINVCLTGIAFLFLISGCSEKSQLPDEPVGSLSKVTITEFTGVFYPTGLIDPGTVKIVGQNYFRTNQVVQCANQMDNDLVAGAAILTKSNRYNVNTGEGVLHGTLSITPDNYPDGIWECTWTGTRTKTGESEWTSVVKMNGIGEGGEIEGMKIHADMVVTDNDIYGDLGFFGEGGGYIKSKE